MTVCRHPRWSGTTFWPTSSPLSAPWTPATVLCARDDSFPAEFRATRAVEAPGVPGVGRAEAGRDSARSARAGARHRAGEGPRRRRTRATGRPPRHLRAIASAAVCQGTHMTTSREQFRQWLEAPEGARLEFKKARHNYHFEKLLQYCVALANEGGGQILLGVSDRRPRTVVGTQAFSEPWAYGSRAPPTTWPPHTGRRVPVRQSTGSDRPRTSAPLRNRMAPGWALSQACRR